MDSVCSSCGECCKRYAVTVLPPEARAQAAFLGMPLKSFLKSKTQLFVQLYPRMQKENGWCVHESMLPKKWAQGLKEKGIQSNFYMVLPQLAFRKKGAFCAFYDARKKQCAIHSVKPGQCTLFPFVPWQAHSTDFSTQYDFCGLSRISSPTNETHQAVLKHQEEVNAYFENARQKGFQRMWPALPSTGMVTCKGLPIALTGKREVLSTLKALKQAKTAFNA
mgnify:CR=1 FL=1